MKTLLFLFLCISTITHTKGLQQYLDKNYPITIEKYKKTLVPDYRIPIFKIATRFQGSTLFLDSKKDITVPMSVTMVDMQAARYTPSFGILRLYIQSPMQASSQSLQQSNLFLQSVNNTSIGIGAGGGWYVYDSRKANTGKGISVLMALIGFWNIGVANSLVPENKYLNNGGAEFNFRVEQNFFRNFGMVYGFDIGFSTLFYKESDPVTNIELSLGTVSIHYGAVIGFTF